jgi:SAM-dependent methyltransferase
MIKNLPATIDWNELWKQARAEKSYISKKAGDWDKKAPSFAKRNSISLYINKFIELLNPEPSWSVLDIGCGPGTLAIPLASTVKSISCLDFSPKMLEILAERVGEKKLPNISAHQLSWTDEWQHHGIKTHDIALASRSLAVDDLRPALEKLTKFSRKKVVITDKVDHGPFDPEAFLAVGRELKTGPDYIYTINLLYQMGIHASIDFIPLESTLPCSSIEEAVDYYMWMFHDLTNVEKKRLKKYVQSITTSTNDGTLAVHRKHIPTWAFISWKP